MFNRTLFVLCLALYGDGLDMGMEGDTPAFPWRSVLEDHFSSPIVTCGAKGEKEVFELNRDELNKEVVVV